MAVITKIRNYSGLLIAVIGIGLAAFVLGDFLGYGPMRQQRLEVGRVEGTSIGFQQFEMRAQQQIENWQAQTGQSAGPREAFQMRQQIWNEMVREVLMGDILDDVGLAVTAEELFNMIHGDDPHPVLRQSFSDPATGQYDPQSVIEFLRTLPQMDPSIQNQWMRLEEFIKQDRREEKYHQLIGNSYFVPSALAAADFKNRNITADIRFIYKSHDGIEEEVTISDRELRRVYDEHKHRFSQEASRNIKYVSLPVFASQEDRENTLNELNELRDEFAQAENVQAFVNAMSDRRFDPSFHSRGTLSPQIDPEIFDMPEGSIIGPYMEDNAYILARLVDSQLRPDSMRASHILIAYQGSAASDPQTVRSYQQAEQKADSLLRIVRNNPGRFAALASELSDDPSAAMNFGDLDWFPDGAMVPAFNEAVVEAPTGSFLTVETEFGFHVIHVTGKSTPQRKVQVAKLVRDILPGSRTYRNEYGRINTFATELRNGKDFDAAADEAGLNVRNADRVGKMDQTIPGVEMGRQIVQWAFDDDTRVGSISRIFEMENNFVVATITGKQEKGTPSLNAIRDDIMAIAVRERKQEMIAAQMEELLAQHNLDEIAAEMELEIKEAENINFNSRNLPGVGPEPKVIGKLFTGTEQMKKGPIKGNNGVFIVEIIHKDDAIVPEDLTQARTPLKNNFKNRVPSQAFNAIKDNARIEDNRAMFF